MNAKARLRSGMWSLGRAATLCLLLVSSAAALSPEETLMSGKAWQDFLANLDAAGASITRPGIPSTPQVRAESYRHLLRLVRSMDLWLLEYADPERPILNRQFDLGTAFAIDNPDTLYYMFPALVDATYLVRAIPPARAPLGLRCRRLLQQLDPALTDPERAAIACGPMPGRTYRPPHFLSLNNLVPQGFGLPRPGLTINNANGTLEVGADGSFEVLVSASPQPGNWLGLEPGVAGQTVFFRQTFNDWEHEGPLELRVTRLNSRGAPPAITAEAMALTLAKVGAATIFQAQRWPQNTMDTQAAGANVLEVPRFRPDLAGLPGQYYAQGFFDVADDQALVVTISPPSECFYWGLQLINFLGESLDYANRKVSINGAQAHVDGDGLFRAVLAHRDPGVPNWLDVGGGETPRQGLMVLRFTECGKSPTFQAPSTKLVALAEARAELPADHPMTTAAERIRELDLRREHLARRLEQ